MTPPAPPEAGGTSTCRHSDIYRAAEFYPQPMLIYLLLLVSVSWCLSLYSALALIFLPILVTVVSL